MGTDKKTPDICYPPEVYPPSNPISLGNIWIGNTRRTPEMWARLREFELERIRALNSSDSEKPGND